MWPKKKKQVRYSDLYPSGYQSSNRGGEVADFTYGNVWARIWRNRRQDGSVYFRASFDRLANQRGRVRLNKSFAPEDLADLGRCIARVEQWLTEHGSL